MENTAIAHPSVVSRAVRLQARKALFATDSYALLDVTPYGRQEDFEDSPPSWPHPPTYG